MSSCHRFVCKNNGVLFENQLLQIGIKSEYRQNLGKLLSHERWNSAALHFNINLDMIFLSSYGLCVKKWLGSDSFVNFFLMSHALILWASQPLGWHNRIEPSH